MLCLYYTLNKHKRVKPNVAKKKKFHCSGVSYTGIYGEISNAIYQDLNFKVLPQMKKLEQEVNWKLKLRVYCACFTVYE